MELMTRKDEYNDERAPAIRTRGEIADKVFALISVELEPNGDILTDGPVMTLSNPSYVNDVMSSDRMSFPVSKRWVAKVKRAHKAECDVMRPSLGPVKYKLLNRAASSVFESGRLAHSFNEKKVSEARKFASLL